MQPSNSSGNDVIRLPLRYGHPRLFTLSSAGIPLTGQGRANTGSRPYIWPRLFIFYTFRNLQHFVIFGRRSQAYKVSSFNGYYLSRVGLWRTSHSGAGGSACLRIRIMPASCLCTYVYSRTKLAESTLLCDLKDDELRETLRKIEAALQKEV